MALVVLALACSLMAKPMLVTLPFLLLLLDYWPLRRFVGLPISEMEPGTSQLQARAFAGAGDTPRRAWGL